MKQVRESQPPKTKMLLPTSVVVCARSGECGAPDVGARDQYMPDVGAAGTSGAVFGSWSGGMGTYGPSRSRGLGTAEARVREGGTVLVVVDVEDVFALLTMAEVERMATGRRESVESLALPPFEEEGRGPD